VSLPHLSWLKKEAGPQNLSVLTAYLLVHVSYLLISCTYACYHLFSKWKKEAGIYWYDEQTTSFSDYFFKKLCYTMIITRLHPSSRTQQKKNNEIKLYFFHSTLLDQKDLSTFGSFNCAELIEDVCDIFIINLSHLF
jgi:hypothetical protein